MNKVGIIGLGRFGTFWASVLAQEYQVFGYTRTKPENPPCELVDLDYLCTLPVIYLCVPMRTMPEILDRIAPLLSPGTLVVDTCSVKMEPVRWMLEKLPKSVDIMATHPMFGPESAKEGLSGLPLMMYPVRMVPALYDEWSHFFRNHGIMVVEITPEEHDQQAAISQALTHMVGKTLNAMGIEENPIGTLWYRKLLAICKQVEKDSPELFSDMQKLNPYAIKMREQFKIAWDSECRNLGDSV